MKTVKVTLNAAITKGYKQAAASYSTMSGRTVNLKNVPVAKAGGGLFKNGKWHNITAAAGGGSFSQGQMFIAREAGPELVGTIGGHTAVMNNDQIVASVSAGVAKAIAGIKFIANNATPQVAAIGPTKQDMSNFAAQLQTTAGDREIISLLRSLITEVQNKETNTYLDGKAIATNTINYINGQVRQTGKLPILI